MGKLGKHMKWSHHGRLQIADIHSSTYASFRR
jgi:hypothetical protein